MKIKFINHACFIVENDGKKIMCDPWFDGSIFDDGWSLMYENSSVREHEYDYVWISHEHPDHFRPNMFCEDKIANNKTIILQQRPNDRKLHDWFTKKNYKVVEVPQSKEINIENCFILGGDLNYDFDSWVYFKFGDKTVLNLNDCISFKNEQDIHDIKKALGHVDVLLTQFSFANWTGNKNDSETPEKAKHIVLTDLKKIFEIIKPDCIIPFASFVCFSHEENSYLNQNSISVKDFVEYFPEEKVVVMKPEDEWDLSEAWEHNNKNIKFWQNCASSVNKNSLTKTKTCDFVTLKKSFNKMKKVLQENNDMVLFKERAFSLKPTDIYLTDLKLSVEYDILTDFKKTRTAKDGCDVIMSSESLYNVMKTAWGFGTLMINGRFQANYDTFSNFVFQTRLFYMNNIGKRFPDSIKIEEITSSPSLVNRLVNLKNVE